MSLHWESSKRPLFIKTIWKDGQRHVLLSKEDPTIKIRRHITPRSPKKTPRTCKTSAVTTVSNIRVSSFKLLEDIKNVDRNEKLTRCKSSPNHSNFRTVVDKTYSVASFPKNCQPSSPTKKVNLSIKSNSIDLTRYPYREYIEETKCIECSPLSLNNPESSILSQRVLVWLDLAFQSSDIDENIKPLADRLNCVPYAQKKPTIIKNRKSAPVYIKEKSTSTNELNEMFHVGPAPELIKMGDQRVSTNSSSSDNPEKRSDTEEPPIISSTVENGIEMPEISNEVNSDKIVTLKRQIHIFMPGLENKRDDCESSILSSNLSTYSSQKFSVLCA